MAAGHLNVEALYAALDEQRRARGISWRQVAQEVGISPSTLTRLGKRKRPDVDSFGALVKWLGVAADEFLRRDIDEFLRRDIDPMVMVSSYLRARKELSSKSVSALENIIRAAYNSLKDKPPAQG